MRYTKLSTLHPLLPPLLLFPTHLPLLSLVTVLVSVISNVLIPIRKEIP